MHRQQQKLGFSPLWLRYYLAWSGSDCYSWLALGNQSFTDSCFQGVYRLAGWLGDWTGASFIVLGRRTGLPCVRRVKKGDNKGGDYTRNRDCFEQGSDQRGGDTQIF